MQGSDGCSQASGLWVGRQERTAGAPVDEAAAQEQHEAVKLSEACSGGRVDGRADGHAARRERRHRCHHLRCHIQAPLGSRAHADRQSAPRRQ